MSILRNETLRPKPNLVDDYFERKWGFIGSFLFFTTGWYLHSVVSKGDFNFIGEFLIKVGLFFVTMFVFWVLRRAFESREESKED